MSVQQEQFGKVDVPVAVPVAAPGQMTMDWNTTPGFTLKQKTSECCRCWCCQPNIDWTLHPWKDQLQADPNLPTLAHIKEDASWCGRLWSWCNPGSRDTTYSAVMGDQDPELVPGTQPPGTFLTHRKDSTLGVNMFIAQGDSGSVRIPCCFCLPYLDTMENGQLIGRTKYICDACPFVPKFLVENAGGQPVYMVRPDTCIGGLCVKCKCGGKGAKACRVPFFIRDPTSLEAFPAFDGATGDNAAQITDLWAGFKNECCHRRNMYTIKYPQNCPVEMKKTLVGSAILVDLCVFEVEDG